MPGAKAVYDRKLKETPEFEYLYYKWLKICQNPHSEDFEKFQGFYDWSMEIGFQLGMKLIRNDESAPYSPENCRWLFLEVRDRSYTTAEQESIDRWNETVNIIRRCVGLKPFEWERCVVDE